HEADAALAISRPGQVLRRDLAGRLRVGRLDRKGGCRAPGARTGQGAQLPLAPSTCCSSPLSYISIMMSEPPMNSPLTYSCGMVGQLL
ncbi:MAG: hypothetical protein RL513_1001, partial [Pseudomonadota bacterium]